MHSSVVVIIITVVSCSRSKTVTIIIILIIASTWIGFVYFFLHIVCLRF